MEDPKVASAETPVVPAAAPEITPSTAPISVRPMRAGQREFTVAVPCGHLDNGKVYRNLVLRTITAGDRRAFGDEKIAQNAGKIITKLIEDKLVRIEGLAKIPQNFVQRLLGFDRDAIIYALRTETVPNRPFLEDPKCPECGVKNHIEVPTSIIEQTRVEMPEAARKSVEGNLCVFHVELPEYGFKGQFRHTTGALQEKLSADMDTTNPFAAEFEILSALILDFNGEGKQTPDELAELDIEFVGTLQDRIREHRFGYDFNPSFKCHRCKTESRARVDPLDFLFAGAKTQTPKTPISYNE